MAIPVHSRRIDQILTARERNAPKAEMLLDQYSILVNGDEREEFVAALIHRMLTEHARRLPEHRRAVFNLAGENIPDQLA